MNYIPILKINILTISYFFKYEIVKKHDTEVIWVVICVHITICVF